MDRKTIAAFSALALVAAAGLLTAGPLTPPGGSVASTYKTLAEIEPRTAINAANTPGDADSIYKITQPGSYYLTGNMVGQVDKRAIEIALATPGSVTLDLNGFEISGVAGNLTFAAIQSTVYAQQTKVVVRNGGIRSWYGAGIELYNTNGSIVEGITVANSFGKGIGGGTGIVRNCVVKNCTEEGISIAGGGVATSCEVISCGGAGIYAFIGCTVENCSVGYCSGNGIEMNQDGTVRDNQTFWNGGDGISVGSFCRVVGNNCSQSGNSGGDGAGIHVTGTKNRIEGNNCNFGDRGIDVDLTGNIIMRNTCAGNTTAWSIAAGNYVAPIVVASTNAGAINGSVYVGSLGSTDPNANFTH